MSLNTIKDALDKATMTLAYSDYKKGLNSHAYFRLNDNTISEDLVQDTFVKTWGYLVRGGKIEIMKAFLYHVLNNLIIDEYRKRKPLSLDGLIEKGFEPSAVNEEPSPLILEGKSALLLIQRLPERYQKIMRMRYVQDLSIKEMSLITGQSRNTMSVQVHRGIAMLKLLYNPIVQKHMVHKRKKA
jgi:RNA polymerase sigma-70 factor (ECF subfamily)